MGNPKLQHQVMRSAASGYVRLALRMVLGVVTFRLLFQGLSPEAFGFWSLLWAIFGYGILLDFGFGYAAQKRVAELTVRGDTQELSRVLSSIVGFYCAAALVAAGLGIGLSGPLVDLFRVSPEHREEYRTVLAVFLAGIGIAFPLGVFPDVLAGQQRLVLANNLAMITNLANFAAVVLVITCRWSLLTLVLLTLAGVILPQIAAARFALGHLPGVRLRPGLISRRTLADTGRFSLYAYVNMLGNVLRNKADQPVISLLIGVSAITPYQAGGKIGEMFGQLTKQIADVLSPTAAHLHARGDTEALRGMLLHGLRFSILLATPLYLLCALQLDPLIRLLTGVDHPTTEMRVTGQVLLLWHYSLVLTHWVFKRMFFMAGQERRMMRQGLAEALANVALSVVLTAVFRSITGVAFGSLIPTVLFGWGLLWGWAAREAGLSRRGLFRAVVLPAWTGCLPLLLLGGVLHWMPWPGAPGWIVRFLAESVLSAAVGAAGLWFLALKPLEREAVIRRLRSRLPAAPRPS